MLNINWVGLKTLHRLYYNSSIKFSVETPKAQSHSVVVVVSLREKWTEMFCRLTFAKSLFRAQFSEHSILWSNIKEKLLNWEEMESLLKGLTKISWDTWHLSWLAQNSWHPPPPLLCLDKDSSRNLKKVSFIIIQPKKRERKLSWKCVQ